ncbi:MAG: hypothetical protein KDI11_07975 [Alphaproteobacteria bacterium]|nr:hypothetical protein [Alphaproteobacteria bacterium]
MYIRVNIRISPFFLLKQPIEERQFVIQFLTLLELGGLQKVEAAVLAFAQIKRAGTQRVQLGAAVDLIFSFVEQAEQDGLRAAAAGADPLPAEAGALASNCTAQSGAAIFLILSGLRGDFLTFQRVALRQPCLFKALAFLQLAQGEVLLLSAIAVAAERLNSADDLAECVKRADSRAEAAGDGGDGSHGNLLSDCCE